MVMFILSNEFFVTWNPKNFSSLGLFKYYKNVLYKAKLLRLAKKHQRIIEQQIKTLSVKLSSKKTVKSDDEEILFLLGELKFLALKLSLNTAEQMVLKNQNVENILQPITAQFVEKKPSFLLDTQWLKKQITFIRKLAGGY